MDDLVEYRCKIKNLQLAVHIHFQKKKNTRCIERMTYVHTKRRTNKVCQQGDFAPKYGKASLNLKLILELPIGPALALFN